MNREQWFANKWKRLKSTGLVAIIGFAFIVVAIITKTQIIAAGGILVAPFFIYVLLVPLFHWKDRYIGDNSNIWGALLLIETSSWSKLVYWFRHVLADYKKRGRYENVE